MGRARLLVLALGIPGLLLYGTLATAQWLGNAALAEFNRLQKEHPSDSMETEDPKIAARKRAALALAARFIPDQSEPAYQAALQNLVLAESESLHPAVSVQNLDSGPDAKVAVLLREALRSINRAIELSPGKAEYPFVKATVLQNLPASLPGSDAVAVEDAVSRLLTTADRLDPYLPSLHYRIGSFWLALGNRERAKHAFTVALRDKYRFASSIFSLLWSSVKNVQEIQNFVADDAACRVLVADFLWYQGYRDAAKEQIEKVETAENFDYGVAEALIEHLLRAERYESARGVIDRTGRQQRSISAHNSARLQFFRGRSFFLQGRYQEAIDCFERSLAADSYLVQAHVALASAYLEGGEPEKAIARWRFVLSHAMQVPSGAAGPGEVHFGLGRAYEALGDKKNALGEYLRASAEDPTNATYARKASELSRGM